MIQSNFVRCSLPLVVGIAVLGFTSLGVTCNSVLAASTTSPCFIQDDEEDEDDEKKKKKREPGEIEVETVVEGLNNPMGVAIQPETGHVFISESGAGRVIRVVKKKVDPVIIEFPMAEYRGLKAGPLSLLFMTKDLLAVGGGGESVGEEKIATYKVPAYVKPKKKKAEGDKEEAEDGEEKKEGGKKEADSDDESEKKEEDKKEEDKDEASDDEADKEDKDKKAEAESDGEAEAEGEAAAEEGPKPGEPVTADKHEEKPLLMPKTDEGGGGENFSAMVKKHMTVYVVAGGEEEKGWIATAKATAEGKLSDLVRKIPTVEMSGYASPSCVAISPEGKHVVVSQMGEKDESADSQLTFYSLKGKLLQNFEVPLHDVTTFAYSPKRKHLFAADFSFADPSKGGLHKIIGSGEECKTKEIQKIERVTSMVFNDKGELYVTVLGEPGEGDEAKPTGKLLLIKGLDETPKPEEED